MADTSAPYDCQACGACCSSPWTGNGYVVLGEIDLALLRPRGILTVTLRYGGSNEPSQLMEKLATRRDEAGRQVCVALDGALAGPCACRIYEHRPQPCRRFEVGGALCREARGRIGLPV